MFNNHRVVVVLAVLAFTATGLVSPADAQSETQSAETPSQSMDDTQTEIEIIRLIAHPSDMDYGQQRIWSAINVDPFQGNVAEASVILSQKTDIRPLERKEAWVMRTSGKCHRYLMKPRDSEHSGDVLRTTFGENRTMLAEVGFTGWADVCIVRPDGTAVVFPDGCANISDALAIVVRRPRPKEYVEAEHCVTYPVTTVGPSHSWKTKDQFLPIPCSPLGGVFTPGIDVTYGGVKGYGIFEYCETVKKEAQQ